MIRALTFARRAGCSISACLLCACASIDVDEVDREAFFPELHLQYRVTGSPDGAQGFVEAGWARAEGEEDELDYRIGRMNLGYGGRTSSEHLRASLSGGLMRQDNDLELSGIDLDAHGSLGPYAVLDVGWRAFPWLEPYTRVEAALLLGEVGDTSSGELGLRLCSWDTVALHMAWRYARYDLSGIDTQLGTVDVELDAVGFVLGLWIRL